MSPQQKLEWSDLDQQAVDTVRVLAMDAVQKVGNGHPGTAMSLAPAAYLLFQRYLRHDPTDPGWTGRDRFVLSAGHSSLTLYIQLYLSGYGLELDDLRSLRTWGSLTPGHPEHGHTAGVETTTGPLGQGIGNAVGMAMAARRERGLLDPDAAPGESPFDHNVWCIASDGDIEEGISSEASSLAGHAAARQPHADLRRQPHLHRGRHLDRALRGHRGPLRGLRLARAARRLGRRRRRRTTRTSPRSRSAYDAAEAETERPSFIALRTDHRVAGAQRAEHRQGARQRARRRRGGGDQEAARASTRRRPSTSTRGAGPRPRGRRPRPRRARRVAGVVRRLGRRATPSGAALLDRLSPGGCRTAGPTRCRSSRPTPRAMATRKASGAVLTAIAPVLPELWGGSADLAESQQHDTRGRAVVPPRGPAVEGVPRRPVRPHPALRHP